MAPRIHPPSAMPNSVAMSTVPSRPGLGGWEMLAHDQRIARGDTALEQAEHARNEVPRHQPKPRSFSISPCGIDTATQHDTPATRSSTCSVPGGSPSGRASGRLAQGWLGVASSGLGRQLPLMPIASAMLQRCVNQREVSATSGAKVAEVTSSPIRMPCARLNCHRFWAAPAAMRPRPSPNAPQAPAPSRQSGLTAGP